MFVRMLDMWLLQISIVISVAHDTYIMLSQCGNETIFM